MPTYLLLATYGSIVPIDDVDADYEVWELDNCYYRVDYQQSTDYPYSVRRVNAQQVATLVA